MKTIDKSGTSVEEIISQFRSEYQIKDYELKYDVIKKPSRGFFGLFASHHALVRFQLPDLEDRASLFTENLLKKMGIGFSSITSKMEGKTLYLEIVGCKDPGFLIGKNGTMLETVQFLVNRVFEYDRKLDRIYIDADGYRERQEDMFFRRFQAQIAKIKSSGKPLTLDPMSPAERRIIHRHVEREKGLRTLTIGEGEKKRIVIFSAKQSEREVLSQSSADDKPLAKKERTPEAPKPRPNSKPRISKPKPAPDDKPALKPNTNRPQPHHHNGSTGEIKE